MLRALSLFLMINLALFPPESDWTPPDQLPKLTGVRRVGFDFETRDDNLTTTGPGCFKNEGYVVGASVYIPGDRSYYFPIKHLLGGNLPERRIREFLQDLLSSESIQKVGSNLLYDICWALAEGYEPKGDFLDIGFAEALLDEEKQATTEDPKPYSLDSLSFKYLGLRKEKTLLREAAIAHGIDPKLAGAHIWQFHSKYVGPYAEADAEQAFLVYSKQEKLLEAENLGHVMKLETDLLHPVSRSMQRGIRVDLDRAEQLAHPTKGSLVYQENELLNTIRNQHDYHGDLWSTSQLAAYAKRLGFHVPTTEKNQESVDRDYLKSSGHPGLLAISKARSLNRLRGTFITKKILQTAHNGRIYTTFNQLRRDEAGTRTGRFSSANPNIQQTPSRDDELGPLIRSLYLPDEGKLWAKLDYSQQEPRIQIHYGMVLGLAGVDMAYDYIIRQKHKVYRLIQDATGQGYNASKIIYLALSYNMGVASLSRLLQCSEEVAQRIFDDLDAKLTYIRRAADIAKKQATSRGYIRTVFGRKRHFNYFEPVDSYDRRMRGEYCTPRIQEEAERLWPKTRLKRSWTSKAYNAAVQGSGGDMVKLGILEAWKYDSSNPFLITMHDECDFQVTEEREALVYKEIFESALKLKCPMVCDLDLGPTWK